MTCPRCGATLTEDRAFTRDMQMYSDPRRRYACQNQHTYMTGMPDVLACRGRDERGRFHRAPRPVKAIRRLCTVCGTSMDGEPIVRHRHAACDVEGRRIYQRALRARDRTLAPAAWVAQ